MLSHGIRVLLEGLDGVTGFVAYPVGQPPLSLFDGDFLNMNTILLSVARRDK